MEGQTLTVAESKHGFVPEGTEVTVVNENENQFSGRRTLSVETDADIPNTLGSLQFHRMESDEMWTEIHVGLKREHEKVRFEK